MNGCLTLNIELSFHEIFLACQMGLAFGIQPNESLRGPSVIGRRESMTRPPLSVKACLLLFLFLNNSLKTLLLTPNT